MFKKNIIRLFGLIAALSIILTGYLIAASTDHQGETSCTVSKSDIKDNTIPEGMVSIKGSTFEMGYKEGHFDETLVHSVTVNSFYLDKYEVTNQQFQKFITATGYITQAEKDGYSWGYKKGTDNIRKIEGANWKHPEGPSSNINNRLDNPVVCVNWFDAAAYAKWSGKRLPTEAEWEYAARSGGKDQYVAETVTDNESPGDVMHSGSMNTLTSTHVTSSDDLSPSAKSHNATANHSSHTTHGGEIIIEANVWQYGFPTYNPESDGHFYSSPSGSYAPNALDIHDMIGNVWEWTGDWYDKDYYNYSPASNPTGPESGEKRVARGGSWFCSPAYCSAFNSHYRGASPPDHSFNNVGFRCAADVNI